MNEHRAHPIHVALLGAEHEENLALRYIAAALAAAGHRVTLIPFNGREDLEEAAAALAGSGAALAGFSMVFTYRARQFADAARRARALGFRGHLVAGGHFAAFHAEQLLRDEPAFDSVALGEGEALMTALAASPAHPAGVAGLVWRDAAGAIHRNGRAAAAGDLDALAPPLRKEPPDAYLGLPVANMLGSRGCTHHCAFCSIAAWHRLCGGARLRLRAPDRIAAEVAALYAQGYRLFNFHDDNFLLDDPAECLARVRRLGAALREHGVGRIAFAVKSRPAGVTDALFRELRDMGLFRVFLGIEAGTAEALRRLGRGQTPDANDRALRVVNALDLHACFNLLLLNPDSTLEDVAANLAWLRGHPDNPMNFCRTEVYAGTPLERLLRSRGALLGDYWGYGYRIADPRAQEFFDLMHMTLYDRHYDIVNVHHLTMSIDFERALRQRFFRCPAELRERVRAFTRRVNLDTADCLETLAAAAAEPFRDDAARRAFIRETADHVARLNLDQAGEGRKLLEELRAGLSRRNAERAWRQRTAAVGVAASLTLVAMASSGRGQGGTHVHEMIAAPPPVQPLPSHPQALRLAFLREALSRLAELIRPAADVEVELEWDAEGRIASAELYPPGGAAAARKRQPAAVDEAALAQAVGRLGAARFADREQAMAALRKAGAAACPLLEKAAASEDPEISARARQLLKEARGVLDIPQREAILRFLRTLALPPPEGKERRAVVAVRAAELQQQWEEMTIRTHICEMAPAPRD